LDAADARAEIGGREPDDPRIVSAPLAAGIRICAVFDEPPADRAAKHERLASLIAPFEDVAARIEVPGSAGLGLARQNELDADLDALAERAGARAAVVFDERSPILWGSSVPRARGWDVDAMERAHALATEVAGAGIDPARWLAEGAPDEETLAELGVDATKAQRWSHRFHRIAELAPHWKAADWREALQVARAIVAARAECRGGHAPERFSAHDDDFGVFARGFAQIYLCALVYDGPFSELHAEGSLVRALPHIETLVLALPPVDPPPRAAAKVIPLRPR
ncbi:MAG TPA: hypothetical protein VIL20_17655, partial [Sandaracinaceae bacterium]